MRKIACAVIVAAALMGAQPAHAGTVTCFGVIHFNADPGEANHIEARLLPGDDVSFIDGAATLKNDGGCSQVGPNEIRAPHQWALDVQTGDGNDTFSSGAGLHARVDPGPGDDTVSVTGPDSEVVTADHPDGADRITFTGPSGYGWMNLSYAARSAAVHVTPDGVPNDGEPGEGDDIRGSMNVIGTAGDDLLQGGDGWSELRGGAGNDQLLGGAGNNWMEGGPGADLIRGGAGEDTASYRAARHGVSVTPDGVANDGEPGEGDNVAADVEDPGGTQFNDTLTGSGAANNMDGGAGDDVIDGRGGNDIIHGGPGDDALFGGSGDDKVGAVDVPFQWEANSWVDRVDCGEGTDLVLTNPGDKFVNCEGGQNSSGTWGCRPASNDPLPPAFGPPTPCPAKVDSVVVSGGGAVVSIACPRRGPRRCRGRASLTVPTRVSAARRRKRANLVLGSRRVSVKRGRRVRVRVPLSRRGQRLVASRKSLTATLTFRYRTRPHRTRSQRRRVQLLAGK